MNIWLVHPFAGGPGLGRHWRPFWLAEAWGKMGHRVVVVSAGFHHLHREPRTPGLHHIEGVDFWFIDAPRYSKNALGRLWNNLSFGPRLKSKSGEIAKQFGAPDILIASSPHLFFVEAARDIARRFGAKFWVEIRDLWPESIVALGMTPAWHPLMRVLGWKERSAYRSAERVICLLAGAEAYMCSRGLPAGRFLWIPNGVSEDEIQRAQTISQLCHPLIARIKDLKQEGARVVLYAGGMGPPNAMEVIIDAAAQLGQSNPEIRFILIGSGTSQAELMRRAAGFKNVEFQDEVDRSVVHGMLNASDCAVVSFHKNALYHHGISPNKLFDYCLFAPRIVIACEEKALAGLEDLITVRCAPDDPAALAASLVSALKEQERPQGDRIAIARSYSYSRLASRYLSHEKGYGATAAES